MIRAGCGWLAGVALALAIAAVPAAAQTREQVASCWDGSSPDQRIEGCTAEIKSGRYEGVNLAILYANRCDDWRVKGDLDRAMDDCNMAIGIDRTYAGAFINRGNLWDIKHDEVRALADYDEAIRLKPDDALGYSMRANAHSARGEHALAIADYDRAARLNPNDPIVYNNRCSEMMLVRRYQAALADCNESLRIRPANASTLQLRAAAYLALGQLDMALADYDASARLGANDPWMLYGRGLARRRRGDTSGDGDIAAARAIEPAIATRFEQFYGIK